MHLTDFKLSYPHQERDLKLTNMANFMVHLIYLSVPVHSLFKLIVK